MDNLPFSEPLHFARNAHLHMLGASGIKDGTAGSCMYASILLSKTLNLYAGWECSVIRGGPGRGDGGYTDARGIQRGHYWVEATDNDGEIYVLDITADQFGGPPVVAVPADKARMTYRPGDQDEVEEHVGQMMTSLFSTVYSA